ncbi:MAG: hypothetical protein M3Y17_09535 [Actinomycetota bacterium]|nr:hypothetical protein [Actinomycetota bacterium]
MAGERRGRVRRAGIGDPTASVDRRVEARCEAARALVDAHVPLARGVDPGVMICGGDRRVRPGEEREPTGRGAQVGELSALRARHRPLAVAGGAEREPTNDQRASARSGDRATTRQRRLDCRDYDSRACDGDDRKYGHPSHGVVVREVEIGERGQIDRSARMGERGGHKRESEPVEAVADLPRGEQRDPEPERPAQAARERDDERERDRAGRVDERPEDRARAACQTGAGQIAPEPALMT